MGGGGRFYKGLEDIWSNTDAGLKGSQGPEIICSGEMGLENRTLRAGAPGFQTEMGL